MTSTALEHPLVRDYLRRLDRATQGLPPDERREIRDGIRAHLGEALSDAPGEADVRNALEALGEPEDIVPTSATPPPARRRGALEIVAVIFLLIGAFVVPVLGWFIGVVLLWVSSAWTTPQKLLGTLVWPGGLAAAAAGAVIPFGATTCTVSGMTVCTEGPPAAVGILIAAVLVLGPIVVAVYLLRVANRPA